MKNGKEAGKDQVNIETLKAGDETIAKQLAKLYTKCITRLEKKLDENQPREQAGFRSKYSTTDHIHAINQLKDKCREYNIPMCVAFVDYEKALDSVQTQAILT